MQELLDLGLSESVLSPIRKTVVRVDGVEVLNLTCWFIQLNMNLPIWVCPWVFKNVIDFWRFVPWYTTDLDLLPGYSSIERPADGFHCPCWRSHRGMPFFRSGLCSSILNKGLKLHSFHVFVGLLFFWFTVSLSLWQTTTHILRVTLHQEVADKGSLCAFDRSIHGWV